MADKHYHTTPRPHTEGPANTWCRPSAAATGLCSSRSRPSSCCRRGEHACRARSHFFVVGRNRNTSCNRAASTQPTPNPTLSPTGSTGPPAARAAPAPLPPPQPPPPRASAAASWTPPRSGCRRPPPRGAPGTGPTRWWMSQSSAAGSGAWPPRSPSSA